MKKLLVILMVVAMASFLFVGCFKVNTAPVITTLVLPDATVGTAYTATVEATDADGDALTFSLVGPTGMVISGAGVISGWTPAEAGTEAVTVVVTDGKDSVSADFTITVSEPEPEPEIELTGIVVDPKTMDLIEGEEETITSVTATYEIRGTEVPIALGDCTYLSDDEEVATVLAGVVTAVAEGEATITVTYEEMTDTCAVTVTAAPPVAVTGVTLDKATLALTVGGATGTLVATVAPADATDQSVTWASSDEAVATVALGVVTPLTAGLTAIAVTTVDGSFNATCVVTVTAPAVVVELDHIVVLPEAMPLFVGGSETITSVTAHYSDGSTAVVTPLTECTFESSDEDVATISLAGKVTAVAKGTATITVSYREEEITKTAYIEETDTVEVTVSAVELANIVVLPSTMTIIAGDSETIDSITAHYNDGTEDEIELDDADIAYESSDEDVATVSVLGVITAEAKGSATITVAYLEDWTYFTDTVVVTVPTPAVHNVTQGEYYTTIEAALAEDLANDTIEVAAGTYRPTIALEIDKEGVTLKSIDGPATTIIDFVDATLTLVGQDYPCIHITAPHVTVEGFTVEEARHAIVIGADTSALNASYAIVTGNKIAVGSGSPAKGFIKCYGGGDYSMILDNTIVVDGGIMLDGDLGIELNGVTVKGNNISKGRILFNFQCIYDNILITENTISESASPAIEIGDDGTPDVLSNIRITYNDITDSEAEGIRISVLCDYSGGLVINYNNIVGNADGILNLAGGAGVDAMNNWWGVASGPTHPTLNPSGTGDSVSDDVDFDPWSTSPN